MNLKENLFSFLASFVLGFLADYLGLGRLVRQALSFVAVRHLLPSPPPAYTISYHEPPPNGSKFTQAPLDSYLLGPEEEPFVYYTDSFYTTWTPPPPPTYDQYIIWGFEVIMACCMVRLFWSSVDLPYKTNQPVGPQRTLLDLASSEMDEDSAAPTPSTVYVTPVLWDMLNLTTDYLLRLMVFYPYVTGIPQRIVPHRHFYPTLDLAQRLPYPAVAIDVGDPNNQPEDEASHSESSPDTSEVSTAIDSDENELEEDSNLNEVVDLPLDQNVEGPAPTNEITNIGFDYVDDDPGTDGPHRPMEEHADLFNANEVSVSPSRDRLSSAAQVVDFASTHVQELHIEAEAIRSSALTTEPSIQFDLAEFFALPRPRHRTESLDTASKAANSTTSAQQLDQVPGSVLELPSEPSAQFDLGEFFALPRHNIHDRQKFFTEKTEPVQNMGRLGTVSPSRQENTLGRQTSLVPRDPNPVVDVALEKELTVSVLAAPSALASPFGKDLVPAAVVPVNTDVLPELRKAIDEETSITDSSARSRTSICIDNSSGLDIQHSVASSSFIRYEHGSPLFAIAEDPESTQDDISLLASPVIHTDERPSLILSPCDNPDSPLLVTPHDFGIILPVIHADILVSSDQLDDGYELFNSSTLPIDFPVIRREMDVVKAIDEDLDDWDWTLLNVALHDQSRIVHAKPPMIIQQPTERHMEDDLFLVSSAASAASSNPGPSNEIVHESDEDNTLDHRRASTHPAQRHIEEVPWTKVDVAPYSLTPAQAEVFPTVCSKYGLILPDPSASAFYHRVGWDLILAEEKRCLKLATKRPSDRKRRCSSVAPISRSLEPPRGYGLSRANFLGVYGALLFTPEKTYANVSRKGVCPSPTSSSAAVSPVSVAGAFESTRAHTRQWSMINLNRSRGGSDVAHNGANLKVQPVIPSLKHCRSLGSLVRPTARQILYPAGQSPEEVPGAGRGRSPSASPKVPHSIWLREVVQKNRADLSSKSTFSAHRRCASQSATTTESSNSLVPSRVNTPTSQRGRPTQSRTRPPGPRESSPGTSAQVTLPSPHVGKGKARETLVPAPALVRSKSHLPRPPALDELAQPSAPSPAKAVYTTVKSGQKASGSMEPMTATLVFPRIDDDDAVRRFEEEQGFV
ncbi:hypothetical protein BDY19DRAFT_1055750 [Irpex rosettiformis]|uniref:Uncharacterized protein n=1 Tax=Irpex rosettiformis TaxID=378272 RepID=A0ACB8U9A5_9APHY|nr:hypothetical protein BDY19DRAFT_1055750 [Irpex rosettiformis]